MKKQETYQEEVEDGEITSSCPDTELSLPMAPDGGWGWMVVFGSFINMVLLDGVLFSFGVFFLELQSYFGESKGKTAMVGSLLMGMSLLMGPVVSVLVNLFGIRPVAMAGAVLCSLSFAISTVAPNITILTITYGFFGGFGICVVYLPSIIAVGFYFEKKRALANGITSSGSGIGAFLYSPMCNALQTEYGWKGALLIISAITLNCLACGALYRPLKTHKKVRTKESRHQDGMIHKCSNNETLVLLQDHKAENPYLTVIRNGHKSRSCQDVSGKRERSGQSKNGILLLCDSTQSLGDTPQALVKNPLNDKAACSGAPPYIATSKSCYAVGTPTTDNCHLHRPLSKKDIFYSGSLLRIPEYRLDHTKSLYSLPAKDSRVAKSGDVENVAVAKETNKWAEIKNSFLQVTGLGLVKQPVFLVTITAFVFWTIHSTILTLLPDYAIQQPGVSNSKAAMLLSVIGITNTLARVLAGWISDLPSINCIWVNVLALVTGGLTCIALAFSYSYVLLVVEAAVFGICMGTWTSLRPIILVELMGLNNLTNAFGLVAMFQGVAFTVGPPIAGTFYEYTRSYMAPFIVAGGALLTSGLLFTILATWSRSHCTALIPTKHTEINLSVSDNVIEEL